VQALVEPVLAHRLLLSRDAVVDGRERVDLLREVTAGVPVPAEAGEDGSAVT
jgi:MoxR-like ATPase